MMYYILSDNEDVKFEEWFSNPSNVRQTSRTHILHNYKFGSFDRNWFIWHYICTKYYLQWQLYSKYNDDVIWIHNFHNFIPVTFAYPKNHWLKKLIVCRIRIFILNSINAFQYSNSNPFRQAGNGLHLIMQ